MCIIEKERHERTFIYFFNFLSRLVLLAGAKQQIHDVGLQYNNGSATTYRRKPRARHYSPAKHSWEKNYWSRVQDLNDAEGGGEINKDRRHIEPEGQEPTTTPSTYTGDDTGRGGAPFPHQDCKQAASLSLNWPIVCPLPRCSNMHTTYTCIYKLYACMYASKQSMHDTSHACGKLMRWQPLSPFTFWAK